MTKRITRSKKLSAVEAARLKKIRAEFQSKRPTIKNLESSGEYESPIKHGEYLTILRIAKLLKLLRRRSGMSLSAVAKNTGMDKATISRLENGVYDNVTIHTLDKLFAAYGKRVVIGLEDATTR